MNNTNKRYAAWWLRMAAIYLVTGVALGNFMGATHDFSLRSVHAHINLLGWASMLGFGLVVQQFADTLNTRLVMLQFWVHQLAVPLMLAGLAALMRGVTAAEPLVGLGAMAVGVAVVMFAINLWRGTTVGKLRAA